MKKIIIQLTVVLLLLSITIQAQDLTYGFRSGLNFSSLDGFLEDGETYDNQTGFFIGFGFGMSFTDIYGIRAELNYSQKGVKRSYDGPSYIYLKSDNDVVKFFSGNKDQFLSISNTYIDIPVYGFARFTNWLELSAGINAGLLIGSNASGTIAFTDSRLDDFSLDLEYNYFSDKAMEGDFGGSKKIAEQGTGDTYTLPTSAGAHFFYEEDPGKLYKFFQVEAMAGISFYLNRGLYLGGRIYYGLMDVTNKEADFSMSEITETNQFISRDDKDTDLTWQASIGFNF